ncbi:ATP-binding protein [Colwellia sp. D2M02]|uniref:ATP-binding protein n=1 Tax=Colwellia sp. D2M02 TaxID=2841562 RepID=UPI0020919745|nr:ATP-binding protein [Colwellia sp. D2M02]
MMHLFQRHLNKLPQVNSLKFRLMLSASLLILLVLPVIGFTLSNAFEQQLANAIKKELSAYSYSILAVAEVDNSQLLMPEQLLENQFNVVESGLYAEITAITPTTLNEQSLWQSYSLLSLPPLSNLPSPKVGQREFSQIDIAGQAHFAFSYSVSFSDSFSGHGNDEFPVTIHIMKDLRDFEQLLQQFQQQLALWLILLTALLLIIQSVWLRWTLKPLHVLQHELQQVEQGKTEQLQQAYPQELLQVTNQLNLLLQTEQKQRVRYRNALSDLAHSLKTPLAVIHSEGHLSNSAIEQIKVINRTIEHQLKRAQSAGESSWHLGVSIAPVVTKLLNSLAKIYRDKAIVFQVSYNGINEKVNVLSEEQQSQHAAQIQTLTFKGDEADLLEMLGNLLDNACKAAKKRVSLSVDTVQKVAEKPKRLVITISDDGEGIDQLMQQAILQRGVRADTYQQGHGIGLAIVRDLVSSYQGTLDISHCAELGGAQFNLTFIEQ